MKHELQTLARLPGVKKVLCQVVNARVLRIQSDASYVDCHTESHGRITELRFEDTFTIKRGDTLYIDVHGTKVPYKIREILHASDVCNMYLLTTHKRTLSSYFLLPTLGKSREYFDWDGYFINSYMHRIGSRREKLKHLYILYRFSTNDAFTELEKKLKRHSLYLGTFNPDVNHIMFVFRIPDPFHEDCITFLKGKYSELSKSLKRQILSFNHFEVGGRMYQVLYKDEKLRKQLEIEYATDIPKNIDLFDRPEWKEEIYTDKLKD